MSLFSRRSTILWAGLTLSMLATAASNATEAAAVAGFDLGPEQNGRPRAKEVAEAIAAIPAQFHFVTPGVFTVAISPGGPPLATYATDAKTVIGADPDYALVIADALGLRLELVPVAWADWPLGLVSGKYDAVISNVGVTEERKEKFDFSTYRQGLHGFLVSEDSKLEKVSEPKDLAGLKVVVAPGTNQDRILQKWSQENVAAGLAPLELQYFDDDANRLLALNSHRADVIVQPHAQLVFIAARDQNIKRIGTLSAGWPERSDVAIATKKGSGIADALTIATNALIKDGTYGKVLARWAVEAEALPESQTNSPGLPKF